MKYEIEMTEQEIKDLRAVRNYFGENDRTMFEHMAYAILDRLVKKFNTPRVSNLACGFCGQPAMDGKTHCERCSVLRVI